jgi:hypothetical protein
VAVPTNSSVPTITGEYAVTLLLSGGNGTWTGSPLGYAYQWQEAEPIYDEGSLVYDDDEIVTDEWADVATATTINFTILTSQLGMMLRLRVIASNGDGASDPAYSEQVGPVRSLTVGSAAGLSAALTAGLSSVDERLILLIGI